MSAGLRLRHDRLLREQAVEMFERGFSYRLTARRLGVSAETVRGWQKTYRVIGKDGLLAMGVKHARYDYETKVAAARAVVDGGMSKPEAMTRVAYSSGSSSSASGYQRKATTSIGSSSAFSISQSPASGSLTR